MPVQWRSGWRPRGTRRSAPSFGTGSLTRPISIEEATGWGALEWAVPIIDVLFDGAADAVDYIVRYLVPKSQYVRLQTNLSSGFDDMDDASRTNINALMALAEHYLDNDGRDALDKAVRLFE